MDFVLVEADGSSRDWIPPPPELMDNPLFLFRVLQSLDDDSVANCRLVCRLWRDISYRLPAKLKLYPEEASLSVARCFPQATSVVMSGSRREWQYPNCGANSVCAFLKSLPNLQHLKVGGIRDRGAYRECLRSLSTVKALDLSQSCYLYQDLKFIVDESDAHKRLTALTVLAMLSLVSLPGVLPFMDQFSSFAFLPSPPLVMEAVHELKICIEYPYRSLTNLWIEKGMMMSPTFPNLRRLEITCEPRLQNQFATAFPDLHMLPNLEILSIGFVAVLGDVLSDVATMSRLKHIGVRGTCSMKSSFKHPVRLTGLQRLESIDLSNKDQLNGRLFSGRLEDLTGLTRMRLEGRRYADRLPCLSSLKHLTIVSDRLDASVMHRIAASTHLEALHLESLETIRARFLIPLKKLREVTLMTEVEDDVFWVLSRMTGLTRLCMKGDDGQLHRMTPSEVHQKVESMRRSGLTTSSLSDAIIDIWDGLNSFWK